MPGRENLSIVPRAGWNRLLLPLCRPGVHQHVPEKLTLLNARGQCLYLIFSDFYIIKCWGKKLKCNFILKSHFFLPPADPVLVRLKIKCFNVSMPYMLPLLEEKIRLHT